MAADTLEIDLSTIFDNIDAQHVEFTAEVDDEPRDFAVLYDVLEALSGDAPDGDAESTFNRFVDQISEAALVALARDSDQNVVIVSENDLEQAL